MTKTTKARYKNGVIEPVEALEIPDGAEITVTIDVASAPSEAAGGIL